MKLYWKSIIAFVVVILAFGLLSACSSKADTVNHNLDNKAEKFQVFRKISVINGITDKEVLSVTGYCSLEYGSIKFDITCKDKDGFYFRDTLKNSDNVFAISQQLRPSDVSDTHYKVNFRPGVLIPDVDVN
jgi:hypothetical protein